MREICAFVVVLYQETVFALICHLKEFFSSYCKVNTFLLCRSSTNPEKPQPITIATTCTTVTHVTQMTSTVSIDPKIIYEDQFADLMGKFDLVFSVRSLRKEINLR